MLAMGINSVMFKFLKSNKPTLKSGHKLYKMQTSMSWSKVLEIKTDLTKMGSVCDNTENFSKVKSKI